MHARTRAYVPALPFACASAFASASTCIGAHAGTHPHTYVHTLTFAFACASARACTYMGPKGAGAGLGENLYSLFAFYEV